MAATSLALDPDVLLSRSGGRRWLLSQTVLLAAVAALLLLVFENSRLDLDLSGRLYDPALGDFPLHHYWLFEQVLHRGMKYASYVLVGIGMVPCWLGWKGELAWLPRRNALLAALGMVLIPIGTSLLKSATNRHCPWDVIEFGGFAPYLGLLVPGPEGIKAGACFPAGHAAAGFLWLVWAVALRPAGRGWARAALALGLLLGSGLGFVRILQGAHFLSHVFWSAWFAWAFSLALAALVRADLSLPERRTALRPEA
ncbi:MAG TPA: phosphatase PAP2 family protein [Azospira sp.]|nr:phosphatase PAP2 family protein [Azospira sp.]